MKKVFNNLDQQVELIQSRGMKINDVNRAKDYLLSNNYYNIINGYSKPFLQSKELYIEGTNFDEIRYLYFFDEEFKRLMFNSMLLAEHHIKSIFAYRFAEQYPDHRYAYLDINSFDPDKILKVGRIISQLSNVLKFNGRHKGNAISYYIHKYNDVPIWVLMDFLDFGQLCSLLECIIPTLQNKIAHDLVSFIESNIEIANERFAPEIMLSLINNIHETRNICAHNKRLIYFECRQSSLYYPPLDNVYNIGRNDERKNVYSTFLSLQCFLSHVEFAQLNNAIRKRIRKILNKQIKTINVNSILNLYGFPDNWEEIDPIKY